MKLLFFGARASCAYLLTVLFFSMCKSTPHFLVILTDMVLIFSLSYLWQYAMLRTLFHNSVSLQKQGLYIIIWTSISTLGVLVCSIIMWGSFCSKEIPLIFIFNELLYIGASSSLLASIMTLYIIATEH